MVNISITLERGFNSFDEYLETQKRLREERRKMIEEDGF